MKLLVVGDPHGKLGKLKRLNLKNIDLILITGDLGKIDLARRYAMKNLEREKMGLPEIEYDIMTSKKIWKEAYKTSMIVMRHLVKFAPVYTLMGNVTSKDKYAREEEKKFGIKLPHLVEDIQKSKNMWVVKNQLRIINGLRIGFLENFLDMSWVKEFNEKDSEKIKMARKETAKAKRILKWFGKVDILVSHQPPYGILDKVNSKLAPKDWRGKYAGSKVVLDYIKKKQPRYVFCGHIHEGKGFKKIGNAKVYNVGCGGDYVLIDF